MVIEITTVMTMMMSMMMKRIGYLLFLLLALNKNEGELNAPQVL